MAVPMSVVMALAIAVSAAIAAVVAFLPTYLEGIESVQETVVMLRANVIGRVDNSLTAFFRGPAQAMSAVHVASRGGMMFGSGTDDQLLRRLCGLLKEVPGVSTMQLFYPVNAVVCDNSLGFAQAGSWNGTHLTTYRFDLQTFNWSLNFRGERTAINTLNLNIGQILSDNVTAAVADENDRWTSVYAGLNTIIYSAYAWIHGPGMSNGILLAGVQPVEVNRQLGLLGLGARARVVVVDGTSRRVIGNSWGEPTSQLLPRWSDLSLPDEQRLRMFEIADLSDPLILRAFEFLGGNAGFFELPQRYSAVMGGGRDRVFVEVSSVRDDYGIDVRVLLAMPELDFLEGTYRARNRTIGGVVGALGALIIVAVVFAVLLARPLNRLASRMYATASLQDIDEDDAPSVLSEIRVMQEAYTTMRAELNRMKVYLPQSVLVGNATDDDDDCEEAGEAGTGSLAHSEETRRSRGHDDKLSRSSRTSGSVRIIDTATRGAVAVAQLNMAKSVTTKRVAMVVFNLVGFLDRVERSGRPTAELPVLQAMLLEVVYKRVRENKGVVDHFQGDHIFVSFNAVTTVASAAKRAALAALSVCADAETEHNRELPPIAVGISGGLAHCGNMGSSELARFNIVGPCCVEAMMLERLARAHLRRSAAAGKRRPSRILASGALVQDINLELLYLACDFVGTAGSQEQQQQQQQPSSSKKIRLVVSVEKQKTIHMDEWNYALADASKRDPYTAINEAFHAAERGEQQQVIEQLLNSAMVIPDVGDDILEAAGRLRDFIGATEGSRKPTEVSFI